MEPKLTQRCIESFSEDSSLLHIFQKAQDNEKRTLLRAWYLGYTSNNAVKTNVKVDDFISESLPEVTRSVAA